MQRKICKCGKKPVIFRRYEGLYLCRNCFCRSIEKKVKRTIRKEGMISSGDKIAVGVSGGKDSTTVLNIMNLIIGPRRDMELIAISIDEGIKGYRKNSIERIKKFCNKLGIEHITFTFKKSLGKTLDERTRGIPKKDGEVCTYCGVGRRYLLNKTARDLKCNKLCLGHNLDDETQTIFMNYIRGDLSRAARVGPITNSSSKKKKGHLFIPRIKPLREIPEKEVALYAMLKGFDISFDKCPNASGIRFEIKEFLNNLEEKYPGVKFAILETFDKISSRVQNTTETEDTIRECKKCREPSAQEICKTCELWRI